MFILKTCFLLSICLFASGDPVGYQSKPRLDGRIVGGFLIDITQVPWQASFELDGEHFCGASIISPRFLLTAAHCTEKMKSQFDNLNIRTGSSVFGEGGEIHKIKRIIPHSDFNPKTIDYDFSLVELVDIIEFNAKAKPIALPNALDKLSDNTFLLVSGWGDTLTLTESTELLRGVEVPIVNQKKCMQAYARFGGITPRMLCAGFDDGEKDACQGDSGGPLANIDDNGNAVLIGVVSWGYGCAKPNYPGVYARVEEVRDWILEHTGL